jgi:hypothetical protein
MNWPPPIGAKLTLGDAESCVVVATFEHDGQTRIVTAHRFAGPRSRWFYEAFGESAWTVGLIRPP